MAAAIAQPALAVDSFRDFNQANFIDGVTGVESARDAIERAQSVIVIKRSVVVAVRLLRTAFVAL